MSNVFAVSMKQSLPLMEIPLTNGFCTRLVRDDFKGQLGAFTPCFTDIVILGAFRLYLDGLDRHRHV